MTSLKRKLEKNKKRLSKKNGPVTGRHLPRGVKLDLPALSQYIVESGKTFEELSEEEVSKFVF